MKILCLHGWGTNGRFMKFQTKNFRKNFKTEFEYVYLDGTYEIDRDRIDDKTYF
jgi:hypothetical protein